MIRFPFASGWRVSPQGSIFDQFSDEDVSVEVTVPHDAMLSSKRSAEHSGGSHTGYFPGGSWKYTKSFDVPPSWRSQSAFLTFEGVYRDASVYVNDALAATWANGYTTFHVELDPFLRYGETNHLRVEARAHEDSRWYSGGGIHRPVHLQLGGRVHVVPTGLRVSTVSLDDDLATVEVVTEIVNSAGVSRTIELELQVADSEGRVVATDRSRITLRAGESALARPRVHVRSPRPWSAETPNLYTASVVLFDSDGETDEATARFGIRTITADPLRGLRINGRTVDLRGAAIHHDNGVIGSVSFPDAEERRVRILKAAGFNAIRSAHNPISTAMLDACDRLGMYVMDETFDMWTVPKTADDYSRRFVDWWERDVDAIVAKDFNHPSVIMYSIGNEIQEIGTPEGARTGRLIAERIRAADSSRIVTNAINGMLAALDRMPAVMAAIGSHDAETGGDFNTMLEQLPDVMEALIALPEVADRLAESAWVLDAVGLNYAESRYLGDVEQFPNRVVYGSETFPTRIAELWTLVVENPHVIGDFTWTGWDYIGEAGIGRPMYPGEPDGLGAPYPWLTANCGDIDITGHRKPISYFRETVFGLRTAPYLVARRPHPSGHVVRPAAWTWSDVEASWNWDLVDGRSIGLEAYAAADVVEFLVNGAVTSRVRVGSTGRPFVAEADVPYSQGVVEAVAYRSGAEVGRSTLRTAGAPVHLDVVPEAATARADSASLIYVDIRLVDAQGTVCPDQDRSILVTVEGPAVMQGFGSAAPVTTGRYVDASSETHRGRALLVLRCTGEAGEIGISVRSGDMTTATTVEAVAEPARLDHAGLYRR